MKGFEAKQQLDIFNLDVLKPLQNKDKEEINKKRKKNEMKRLYHTLKISNILDNKCKPCEFREKNVCYGCNFYEELLEHGRGIQETTKDKIHKESWENDRNYKKDQTRERLFTYELLAELETDYKPEEIMERIKEVPMYKVAEEIDCEYNVMKSFVNKYRKKDNKNG